jgi:hypothetical protein
VHQLATQCGAERIVNGRLWPAGRAQQLAEAAQLRVLKYVLQL